MFAIPNGVPHNTLAPDGAVSVSIIKNLNLLDCIPDLIKAITMCFGSIYTSYKSTDTQTPQLDYLPLHKEGSIVFPNDLANCVFLTTLAREFRVIYNFSIDDVLFVFAKIKPLSNFYNNEIGSTCTL